jgi:hypothetical protein
MPGPRCLPWALLGVAFLLPWAGIAHQGDLDHSGTISLLVRYFAATGVFLAALVLATRRKRVSRAEVWTIVVVAVVARVLLLGTTPSLSEDAWRYRWEGQVQGAGVNPYSTPPDDPSLRPLRDGGWLRLNHREVPAIYGPALQLLFRALAALPGELLPFKLAFFLADLALLALILAGVRRRGISPLWALLYAWHPMAILEIAGQGHLEVVPVALMLLAIELEERGRGRAAAFALGLSIAAKYLPVLLVPAFLLRAPTWRARAERLGWIAAPILLTTLPYLGAGRALGTGLGAYGQSWRFNEGGFWLLDQALRVTGVSQAFAAHVLPHVIDMPPGMDPTNHQTWLTIPTKLLAGAVALAGIAWATWPRDGEIDLRRVGFVAGALFVLLSPTVHPWYALWLLPFLPTASLASGRAAWLHLTLCLPLAYAVRIRYSGMPGSWVEHPGVRLAEWLPLAGLLVWAALKTRGPQEVQSSSSS